MIKDCKLLIGLHHSVWFKCWKSMQNKVARTSKYKMINFDDYTNENKIEYNLKWLYLPDHPYKILMIGGFGSGKTKALFDLIDNQPDIDKIYQYAKDPCEENINISVKK